MKRRLRDILLGILCMLAIILALVTRTSAAQDLPAWWRLGFEPMCKELPVECAPYKVGSEWQVELSGELHRLLEQVNRDVNQSVKYQRDIDHFGVPERWSYPIDGKGDCEDFALEKRRRLVELGFSRRQMLLAIVDDHQFELHAVLVFRTDYGDMVLDNHRGSVLVKEATGYRFVWIQSQITPTIFDKVGS